MLLSPCEIEKVNYLPSHFICLIRLPQCLTPYFSSSFVSSLFLSPKAIHLFLTSYQQRKHLTDEAGCPSLLCVLKTDHGIPTMESVPERQLHPHPHRLIPGVRKPRHLSGPATALAWESTNRRDKRGNAADNSRSCTVHTRSAFHHTHWWNLLPVNMHCSKHHYLLQMKEKNHLLLKSAQLQIWYIWKLDSFASLN